MNKRKFCLGKPLYIYIYRVALALILVSGLVLSQFNSVSHASESIFNTPTTNPSVGSGLSLSDQNLLKELSNLPVSSVLIWTKNEIPDGWLECNGQNVDPDLYPDLYSIMRKTPNYQGMFLRGHGNQEFTQNNGSQIGNTKTVYASSSLGEIQGDSTRNHKGVIGSVDGPASYIFQKSMAYVTGAAHSGGQRAGSEDTIVYYDFSRIFPTSNEIRPINIAVKYIIKAR